MGRSHKRGRKAKGEGHVERRYQDQRIERNRRSLTREQQPEPDEAGPEPGQEQQAAPLVAVQPAIDLVYLHLLSDEKGPVYMHFLSPADLAALECTSRAHKAVVKPMRKKAFAALKDPAHPHHHMLTDGLVDKHNILPFISLMAGRTRCAICREFIRRCDLRVANRSLRQQLTGTPLCHACGTSCKIRSHAFDLVDEVVVAHCHATGERRVRASVLRDVRIRVTKTGAAKSLSEIINQHYHSMIFIPRHLVTSGQVFLRQPCPEDPSDEWIVLRPHIP